MSAAAEYYGYLLSQGYGEHQLNQFADFARQANRGEISHNKAYRLACKAGFNSLEGEEDTEKGFTDWMKMGQKAGWIDNGVVNKQLVDKSLTPNKKNKKDNSFILKGLLIVGIGVAIYYATRKK